MQHRSSVYLLSAKNGLNGFISRTAKSNATHLVAAWAYLKDRRLFEPWNHRKATNRISTDADWGPEVLHNELVDLLRVGSGLEAFARLEAEQTIK